MTVPSEQQCALCERKAVDSEQHSTLCEQHLTARNDGELVGITPGGGSSGDINEHSEEEYIQDPTFDATPDAVREHYRRCQDVYETMGNLDGCPTTGFIGNSGWYKYHFEYDLSSDALANGHRIHRRAYTIEADFDTLIRGIKRKPDNSSW